MNAQKMHQKYEVQTLRGNVCDGQRAQFSSLDTKQESKQIAELELLDACCAESNLLDACCAELDLLDTQSSVQTKGWIQGLIHQIKLTSRAMELLTSLFKSSIMLINPQVPGTLYTSACPICAFYLSISDIDVTYCSCTYHPFCLAIQMENNPSPNCRPHQLHCILLFQFIA